MNVKDRTEMKVRLVKELHTMDPNISNKEIQRRLTGAFGKGLDNVVLRDTRVSLGYVPKSVAKRPSFKDPIIQAKAIEARRQNAAWRQRQRDVQTSTENLASHIREHARKHARIIYKAEPFVPPPATLASPSGRSVAAVQFPHCSLYIINAVKQLSEHLQRRGLGKVVLTVTTDGFSVTEA